MSCAPLEPATNEDGDSLPQAAWGAHEVLIESPRHVRDLTELSTREVAEVLQVASQRVAHWAADERVRQVLLFKNVGYAAGASLEHLHSQLLALPYVPQAIEAELAGAERYFAAHGRCVFCDLVAEELAEGTRRVAASEAFVAFCPYAARQPLETWIVPRQHASRFDPLDDSQAIALAEMICDLVARLAARIRPLAYNLLLHTSPSDTTCGDSYHWHWELIPRTTQLAGLEWGAGLYLNPVSPERAAEWLRASQT